MPLDTIDAIQHLSCILQVDVEPLSRFQQAWRPDEPERLDPVHVERVSLRDAIASRKGLNVQNMLGNVELIEPTFQVGPLHSFRRRTQSPMRDMLYDRAMAVHC